MAGDQQVGEIMQINKVGYGQAVSIFVGQYFSSNTYLANKCVSQISQLIKGIRLYQKHLSEIT
jgi:hypothetical protein